VFLDAWQAACQQTGNVPPPHERERCWRQWLESGLPIDRPRMLALLRAVRAPRRGGGMGLPVVIHHRLQMACREPGEEG
jgi:hypothetical protein